MLIFQNKISFYNFIFQYFKVQFSLFLYEIWNKLVGNISLSGVVYTISVFLEFGVFQKSQKHNLKDKKVTFNQELYYQISIKRKKL